MNYQRIVELALWAWNSSLRYSKDWRVWALALVGAALLAVAAYLSGVMPGPEPIPPEPPPVQMQGQTHYTGWIDDPVAVQQAMHDVERKQGFAPEWGTAFKADPFGDDDSPRFFWAAEEKVLGRVIPSWDQKNIGSCVSFGWGRACNDLTLIQIIATGREEWPGAEVATEPIYGGSRVEAGRDGGGGDGSTGGWAAKWVSEWGVLFRKKYGSHDLTSYDVSRCRQYGSKGCPDDLEAIAREHPVKGVAMVTSAAQAWEAIGSGYPIPCCSNVGFQSPLKEGFCARSGSWAHCMTFRGRFVHPQRGKCFVIQNSWGDYLSSGDPNVEVKGMGKVRIPTGCFCITSADADAILKQRDSYAISAFKGFPARHIDWLIRFNPQEDLLYATAPVRNLRRGDLFGSVASRRFLRPGARRARPRPGDGREALRLSHNRRVPLRPRDLRLRSRLPAKV